MNNTFMLEMEQSLEYLCNNGSDILLAEAIADEYLCEQFTTLA